MRAILKSLLLILLCFVRFGTLQAQNAHWQFNPYSYQYDMTVCLSLTIGENPVTDYSDYEIAAFCGDECRGIAKILVAEKNGVETPYGYLRVWSNQAEGEQITFKVYKRSLNIEKKVKNVNVTFHYLDMIGLPSNPLIFVPIFPSLLGDANGDGHVSIVDAVIVIHYVLGTNSDNFVFENADANNNDFISISDALDIVNIILADPNNP